MTYKDVVQAFAYASNRYSLDDDYLREHDCEVREDMPMAGEFKYSVVYLRDDAVEVLIKRIIELENKMENK